MKVWRFLPSYCRRMMEEKLVFCVKIVVSLLPL